MAFIYILFFFAVLPLFNASKCPGPDWKLKENSSDCYFFSTDVVEKSRKIVSWSEAQKDCKIRGGRLADVQNMDEYKYFATQLRNAPSLYMEYWIGLTHAAGSWKWTEIDTPFVTNSIDAFNPNNSQDFAALSVGNAKRSLYRGVLIHETDGCVRITVQTTRDQLMDTSVSKNYLCKANHKTAESRGSSRTIKKECDEGWIFMNKHCYKFIPEMVPYKSAAESCKNQDQDSNLLFITSITEEKSIRELGINTTDSESFWIALQIIAPDQWFWQYRDSTEKWIIPLAYTNWAPNQPILSSNYSASNPVCAFIKTEKDSHWETDSCDQMHPYICKKTAKLPPIVHSTLSPPPINYTYGCPASWTKSGEHCYRRNDSYLSWTEAQMNCRIFGAKLATLFSSTQHQMISHLFNGAWIGMNSLAQPEDPRQFVNDDDSHPMYTPWLEQIPRPGAPNSLNDANCVASLNIAGINTGSSIGMSQYSCEEQRPFVCMISLQPLELHPADCIKPPEDEGCRRWGYGHRGSCFYMGNDPGEPLGTRRLVTFDAARRFCQEYFGGDLAVINSSDKQEFMTMLLATWTSEYWIGLRESEDSWAAFQTWVNNESIPVTNWAHGQPSREQVGKGCVALNGIRNDYYLPGDWYVAGCQELKFALCEAPRQGWTNLPVVPTPFPSGCPLGWSTPDETSRNCYKAFYAPESTPDSNSDIVKLTWQEAEDSCVDFSGHLASVSSQSEQNHIVQKVLKNTFSGYNYWIGLSEDAQSWTWSDGSPFLSTNFFDSAVDHSSSEVQDCVAMNANSGLWVKQNCQMGWGWVCEIAKGIYHDGQEVPTVMTPTLANATCGVSNAGEWFYDAITDNCFFVSKTRDSWANSERFCNLMDAHLATVEKIEHGFVTIILSRHSAIDTLFWIGLRLQNPIRMTHNWVDGNLANIFRAWDKDEPNPKGVQGCVVMNNRNGFWKDDYCLRNPGYRFLCRKTKIAFVPNTTISPAVAENWGCPSSCVNCSRFRDSCYYFSPKNELKTWDQSREICREIYQHPTDITKSSDLVSIHDKLEQDFLFANLGLDQSSRWIGLHEDWDKVTMFWSDQTPFDFTFWEGREPLFNSQPECVHMYGETNYGNGRWNDLTCNSRNGYICKMKKDPTEKPPILDSETNCASGFENLNGICFAVVAVPIEKNPENICSVLDKKARMATITNPYENAFVRVLFAKIRNESSSFEGRAWLGGKEQKKRLIWDSGCYPSFNNIANFYTNNEQSESCVAMDYDGKWRTQACNESNLYVVCEKRPVECAKLISENNGSCPVGFDDECHDYCYRITHSSSSGQSGVGVKATWGAAKAACISLNASIVSIRSEKEQKCLEKYLETSASTLWIGLYEDFDPLTKNGTWKWLDQEFSYEGNFINWQTGEPNGLNIIGPYRESCAEIMPNGRWNNVPCELGVARGYICEKLKVSSQTTETGPDVTTSPTSTSLFGSTIMTNPAIVSLGSTLMVPTTEKSTVTAVTFVPVNHTLDSNDGQSKGPPFSAINSGGIAAVVVVIILLVPILTVAAYIYWKRKIDSSLTFSTRSLSFSNRLSSDQRPVLVEGYDSYT